MEEDRGGETSSPFWSRGRPRRTVSGASNVSASSSSSPGAAAAVLRPWALVLLLAVVVVLFVPSYVSTSLRGMRPGGGGGLLKNWWDALNFVLVLFAIMCGFLGRNQEAAGEERAAERVHAGSASSAVHDWVAGYSADFGRRDQGGFDGAGPVVGAGDDPAATRMGRLRRSSSSYPDLREETWGSVDGWRFTDDFQLYNHRRSRRSEGIRAWEGTPRDTDHLKTIHVDTFVARSSSPPSTPPTPPNVVSVPPEEEPRWPQKPRGKEAERSRGLDGSEIQARVPPSAPPPPPPPPAPPFPPSTAPRRSFEKLPRTDLGRKTASTRFHSLGEVPSSQPMRSSPPPVMTSTPPPPPPPPPPASPMREQSRSHRRRSGGAKEIKIALAQFYQKRKKKADQKDRRSSDDPALSPPSSSPPTATTPPPPPPPPPRLSSGFFQRFSNKKGGSKSKRVHSVPAPPPPPPRPPTHSRKHASRPPMPPSTRPSVHRLDSFVFRPPPPPPPPPPPRPSVDRRSSSTDPPENSSSISDAAANNKTQTEDPEGKPQTSPFCPSPDVNTKADDFIARLYAGWRLEKLNSIREKQQL